MSILVRLRIRSQKHTLNLVPGQASKAHVLLDIRATRRRVAKTI